MLSYFKIEYRMPYFENKINRFAIRNSETQKAITSGVKKFNEKSWKEFGRWLYSFIHSFFILDHHNNSKCMVTQ